MSFREMTRKSVIQGECFVTDDPFLQYSTVLGSCIAVCMYEPEAKVGGMNHFLLPGSENSGSGDMKYGVYSMELLINGLLKLGADRYKLEAKIFGGGEISQSSQKIGPKNQAFTKKFLQNEGIPCMAENLGGAFARKLQFIPTTGKVRHMLISADESPVENLAPAVVSPTESDIELF